MELTYLRNLRENPDYAFLFDMDVNVLDPNGNIIETIKCHRSVLAQSNYFFAMMQMPFTGTVAIDFPRDHADVAKTVLDSMYGIKSSQKINWKELLSIIKCKHLLSIDAIEDLEKLTTPTKFFAEMVMMFSELDLKSNPKTLTKLRELLIKAPTKSHLIKLCPETPSHVTDLIYVPVASYQKKYNKRTYEYAYYDADNQLVSTSYRTTNSDTVIVHKGCRSILHYRNTIDITNLHTYQNDFFVYHERYAIFGDNLFFVTNNLANVYKLIDMRMCISYTLPIYVQMKSVLNWKEEGEELILIIDDKPVVRFDAKGRIIQ